MTPARPRPGPSRARSGSAPATSGPADCRPAGSTPACRQWDWPQRGRSPPPRRRGCSPRPRCGRCRRPRPPAPAARRRRPRRHGRRARPEDHMTGNPAEPRQYWAGDLAATVTAQGQGQVADYLSGYLAGPVGTHDLPRYQVSLHTGHEELARASARTAGLPVTLVEPVPGVTLAGSTGADGSRLFTVAGDRLENAPGAWAASISGDRVDLHVADPARGPRHVLRIIREAHAPRLRGRRSGRPARCGSGGGRRDRHDLRAARGRQDHRSRGAPAPVRPPRPAAVQRPAPGLQRPSGSRGPASRPGRQGNARRVPRPRGRRPRRTAGEARRAPPRPPCRASSGPPARSPSLPGTSPPHSGPGWRPAARWPRSSSRP